MKPYLYLGSVLPVGLIHRPFLVTPSDIAVLVNELETHDIVSFWGYSNTAQAAAQFLGVKLNAEDCRPKLKVTADGYFHVLGEPASTKDTPFFFVHPIFAPGFKPEPRTTVSLTQISGWKVVRGVYV